MIPLARQARRKRSNHYPPPEFARVYANQRTGRKRKRRASRNPSHASARTARTFPQLWSTLPILRLWPAGLTGRSHAPDRPPAHRVRLLGETVGCGTVGRGVSLPDATSGTPPAPPRLLPVDLPRELNKTTLEVYRVEPGRTLILPHDLESKVRLPADQTVLADGTID